MSPYRIMPDNACTTILIIINFNYLLQYSPFLFLVSFYLLLVCRTHRCDNINNKLYNVFGAIRQANDCYLLRLETDSSCVNVVVVDVNFQMLMNWEECEFRSKIHYFIYSIATTSIIFFFIKNPSCTHSHT